MRQNVKIYCNDTFACRTDSMHVYFRTRAVYFYKSCLLSCCLFRKCLFPELTCDKCVYSI